MWRQPWRKGLSGAGALLLTVAAGCTVTVQPWAKQNAPAMPSSPAGTPGHEPPSTSPYSQGLVQTSAGRAPAGPHGNLPPTNGNPQSPYGHLPGLANAEVVVNLNKQLNESEDIRRVLMEQVQALRKSVKDREENVRQASYEVEESSKQIKRTRDDFRQWHSELEEVRERIRKLEDSRTALRPLIEDILRQLDRDREAFKLTVPPQSAK